MQLILSKDNKSSYRRGASQLLFIMTESFLSQQYERKLSVSVRKKTGASNGVSAQRIFIYTAIPTA